MFIQKNLMRAARLRSVSDDSVVIEGVKIVIKW